MDPRVKPAGDSVPVARACANSGTLRRVSGLTSEIDRLLCRRGLRLRRALRPIVRLRLGLLQRLFGLEAWRHRAVDARQDLVVLDVERAQPALLAHGQRDEVADLDQLRLAEVL